MPWVTINFLEGRSAEQKRKMHESVCKAVSESLNVAPEKVHVQLVEMKHEDHSLGGKQI